eukprot:TRINITY_DN5715_c0_g3_i1.p2 TRINITY_DN5715_c0_g3~~TRINITY_DN5715_c0_g3_i1.p2  ORF type:complete len:215 (-),score=44.65 TRINITY_DN5715_c0_g3_i1:278-922(-)
MSPSLKALVSLYFSLVSPATYHPINQFRSRLRLSFSLSNAIQSSINLHCFSHPRLSQQALENALAQVLPGHHLLTHHLPQRLQRLQRPPIPAEPQHKAPIGRFVDDAGRIGSQHPIEDLHRLFGPLLIKVGEREHSGDGEEVGAGVGIASETGEEGHGLGEIGLVGEAVDEGGEIGKKRVDEEAGVEEADGVGEVVGLAEAWDEKVYLGQFFCC